MAEHDEEIVAALYDGILDEARLSEGLDRLATKLRCASAALIAIDPQEAEFNTLVGTGLFDAAAQRRYEEEFAPLDPALPRFRALGCGRAGSTDQLLSAELRRRDVFFNDYFRPLGLCETVAGLVSAQDGRFAVLALHRSPERAAFAESEVGALERLLPHLFRALQIRRRIGRLDAVRGGLAAVMDRLSVGVVILGGDGIGLHANRAAEAIARRGDGLALDRCGVPRAAQAEAEAALRRLRRDAAAGGAGGIVLVPRAEAPPYAVLVARFAQAAGAASDAEPCRQPVLVLIHDPDARILGGEDAIAAIFGLPLAAAKLIAAMLAGEAPNAYADRLGLSRETVRFHLKTAFSRTGLRSQTQLVRAAMRALAELGERKP